MHDQHRERDAPGDVQRALGFGRAPWRAASASALASVSGGPQRPPVRLSAIGACTLCSSGRPRRATAAGRRRPPGCGSRSACASRTARPSRSRAPRSRAGGRGTAARRGRGASRSRTGRFHRARTHVAHRDRALIAAPRCAREHAPQPREARVLLERAARVAQRARDVLDVHRVAARRRLVAERAERLQVALQRHQIEPAPELGRVVAFAARRAACSARKYAISSSRSRSPMSTYESRSSDAEIVGVRSEPRVLEVDDVEPAVVQHQVAAVVVAMAEHAWLGGQLAARWPPTPRRSASLLCRASA